MVFSRQAQETEIEKPVSNLHFVSVAPRLSCENAHGTYCQVGRIRAAHKGRKSWNPPEAQKGLRAASLGIRVDPILGSMFLARFWTHLQRRIDLTNTFKSFFRDDSVKLCSKIAGFLGKKRLGCLGERVTQGLADLSFS